MPAPDKPATNLHGYIQSPLSINDYKLQVQIFGPVSRLDLVASEAKQWLWGATTVRKPQFCTFGQDNIVDPI